MSHIIVFQREKVTREVFLSLMTMTGDASPEFSCGRDFSEEVESGKEIKKRDNGKIFTALRSQLEKRCHRNKR